MLLGVVFKQTRHGAADEIPLKGDYSRRDFERSARFHGVADFRMPSRFPIPTQAPARIVLWQKAMDPPRAVRAAAGAPSRILRSTTSTSPTPDAAAAIAAEVGRSTPRPRATAIDDPAIKEVLKREVDGAIARGVFGSPFVFVDGEPFWGLDRFDQIDGGSRRAAFDAMAEYTLYCFAQSGNAYKPALALELAGADWAPRFVDYFGGETRTPAYRAINVMGEVPVLEHGVSVCRSRA